MTWYALRTASQKEFATQEILNRCGFRAIVPHEWRVLRRSRHVKRREHRIYPMLVGYVFVEVMRPPDWWKIFSMRCVTSVVGFGGEPTPIPQAGIDRLLSLTGQSIPHVLSRNTRRAFVPGDDVRISDGALKGYEGKVESIQGKHARMVFEMLGALREIDVPIETLEAA